VIPAGTEGDPIALDAISVKAGTHVIIELSSPESTHELVNEAFDIHVTPE
jgi:hypothetical protein